jgi:hypothetical protein
MKNKILFSSTFFFSVLAFTVVTISVYQFKSIYKNTSSEIVKEADVDMNADNNEEGNASSKVISFFSFILNFSKSPN